MTKYHMDCENEPRTRHIGTDRAQGKLGILNRFSKNMVIVPLILLLVIAGTGCSKNQKTLTVTPPALELATPSTKNGNVREVNLGLATVDLGVGINRFAFGIIDSNSKPVRVQTAKATFMYIATTPFEVRAIATANFSSWPTGQAGVYVVKEVHLDQEGRWGLLVEVEADDGIVEVGQLGFEVKSKPSSIEIGSFPPAIQNKTSDSVESLTEITTSPVPDPDLYKLTIADAIKLDKPTVISFSTPAFCTTATCGPQIEVISALKERHQSEASFIHIEIYDNLLEMKGDLSKGIISPVVQEWGLISEPYTFILDDQGLIKFKFEGFVTEKELESALSELLG